MPESADVKSAPPSVSQLSSNQLHVVQLTGLSVQVVANAEVLEMPMLITARIISLNMVFMNSPFQSL